tara:strand:- start:22293 stop:22946 length:654 start_codon:yes stop_codon:yes gene_type:complete
MAWRYIQRDFQAGDILDPEDWNQNVREYIEEINGALDRDNIPTASVVVGEEVASEAFNAFVSDGLDSTQQLEMDTTSFQDIDMTVNLTAVSDELLICETSIQFDTADPTQTYNGTNYNNGYVKFTTGTLRDWLRYEFIMTLDGYQIAYAGPFTAYHKRQPVYMVGALPVEAGAHAVRCAVRLFAAKDGGDTVTWDSSTQDFSPRIEKGTLIVNRRKR